MTWRRTVLIGGLMTLPLMSRPTIAQQEEAKVPRIGILTPADNDRTPVFDAFRQGLSELGYVEGRDFLLDFRFARGDLGVIPDLAKELVALPVDVILTDGSSVARVAQEATSAIPIVMGTTSDPVGSGLVASLARPGGNITGFSLVTTELSTKRLELLKMAFPKAGAVAVLVNPKNPVAESGFQAVQEVARSFGLTLARAEAGDPKVLRALPPAALRQGDALLVLPDPMFWNRRKEIVALVAAARVPALYPERDYADEGGLLAYGPNVPDNFRRAAGYVDRILKGADPGDLPVQQPTKFDFVVNLGTARDLGLELPQSLLLRANEVIE